MSAFCDEFAADHEPLGERAKVYTIKPLLLGVLQGADQSMFVLGMGPGTKVDAPCIGWLIEGDQGEKVLVDTGPHASDAPTAHYHTPIVQKPEHCLDQALRAAGTDLSEIDTVIFTHLHYDHTHGCGLVERARFYVQGAELAYAINPIEWHRGSFEAMLPEANPSWFDVYRRMRVIDGDEELMPGLRYHLLPGHTPGSAGVSVQTAEGVYLVAGDTIPMIENWEGNRRHRHIPSALVTNTIDYYHSLNKIEGLADHVLPSHDARAFDRRVYP